MLVDTKLRHDVIEQLDWEPSIDASQIGVAAKDGVVTLTGCVPTYAQKEKAEREAKLVYGVKAVANDIEVSISDSLQRNDTDIATAALNVLKWDTVVPQDCVTVTVSKGWVTLEGAVEWQYQRTAAEGDVRRLAGVRGVTNRIMLKTRSKKSDVMDKIQSAFRRSAELDARRVGVVMSDGQVVLQGNVRSWAEREEAQKAAWAAPGVVAVDNQLSVTP
jgi:osmotically-inducible protein OsmY